jgi:GNAT superfamily N-acetyltransferase
MQQVSKGGMSAIASLFADMGDTLILSCLQGHMGRAWTDDAACPHAAQIISGDNCFLAGDSENEDATALASHIPDSFCSPELYIIPQHEGWTARIEEAFGDRAKRFTRYALKKDASGLETERLEAIIREMPPEYRIMPIDARLFEQTRRESWCRDWCSQFDGYADYAHRGLGFTALLGDEPVSGASSYTVYDGGIEIEIDTKKEHRRKGLAAACAARLILACRERGLYPNWDAANQKSLALALKLGYRFDREYPAYAVTL